ncbi:hypothetical protein KPH14_004049 [Odynerus spinipes]|uniref:Uncharacterized protein n=1 Tax=Odynerus spinipes TaxID=1348599 RepID=A0AAD9RYK5_9HYME|nr:hypothetical protein KPH14_004049 [Odynerus spinipes]
MSSLIVAQDQRIMMLEFAVENLHVPQNSIFDKAISKKVTIMFRFLDEDWTELLPNRRDHHSYRGSNYENELFYGGRSVVFALPESSLEKPMNEIDVQVYVFKEICSYFELDSYENIGFALLRVDHLVNSIIKEIQERKELGPYLCKFHEEDPISRSLVGTYSLVNDDLKNTEFTIKVYIRITYLGNCIVTEFENSKGIRMAFHCRKDNVEGHPYQLRELTSENLQTGCWGSQQYLSTVLRNQLACYCAQDKIEKEILAQLIAAAEARRAAKLRALQKDTSSKKTKKKKKDKDPDAHILANIDDLYDERIRLLMEALKERRCRGFGAAGVHVDRPTRGEICGRLPPCGMPCGLPCSPIAQCFTPFPNFLSCINRSYPPYTTFCL